MRNISIDVNLETVSILGYEVSGSVFADVTCDSTPDSMMPGIELNLYNGLNGNGSIIDTTTSDSNGDFVFFPQADGNYTVCLADDNCRWNFWNVCYCLSNFGSFYYWG